VTDSSSSSSADLWRLSATDLAQRIRGRAVSAREAAQAALARIEAVNPRINAVVECRPEDVLAQADAVDRALGRGEDPGQLAGVPVTVKVNTDQAGYATTNGLVGQRDLVAAASSPVVDNLKRAGAVILGRTNTPAFSLRWFTSNLLHGATRNPRDPRLTPGGSSGGAAAAVTAGIGHLAHGTDIGGSIRYPAYACGVHGLRPTPGRVAAWNASSPERGIGPQLMAVSGPIGRTIADLRAGLAALAAPDVRDPWWTPVPLEGAPKPKRVALCVRPEGLATVPEVEAALRDAARRLERAGWEVEEVETLPPLREAAALQMQLWLGDGFAGFAEAVEREGDPGALATLAGVRPMAEALAPDAIPRALTRRAALVREWQAFLERHPVVLMPVSAELPFADGLDLEDGRRVVEAQLTQTSLPVLGFPGLAVATGMAGSAPVGVQLVAGRFREDLCLAAGEAIEAGGVPPAPVDP
jgi:amidase